MVASHGDSSPGGGVHGDSFQAIAHYFQQRNCRNCTRPYTAEGIEFLREEPGVIVVRVGCANCGSPLGIALVGMNNLPPALNGAPAPERPIHRRHPRDWSKRDADRLTDKPPISYDDVLAAHQFFAEVGDNWSQFLPKIGKAARLRST